MAARCLDLTDDAATDPAIAGAKAAGLARARAAGLPVLPGVVVPAAESQPVVDAAMAAGRGGRPRMAAMEVEPDGLLLAELQERVSALESPFIVRSSSPLEADGTWSGAFSSFHGISPADLGSAVRGCWGSAFSVPVVDRAERTGTPTQRLRLAVLVQPEMQPDVGGTAVLARDGTVRITATDGPLRPLMAGHVEGRTATVSVGGAVHSAEPAEHDLLRRVAELCRRVADLLDHHLIEWAAVAGEVTLLQSVRHTPVAAGSPARPVDGVLATDAALRIAGLTRRFAGHLAEELVLPWAVGSRAVPDLPPAGRGGDPAAALAAARARAGHLVTVLWGGSPRAAAARADQVLRRLRGSDPRGAVEAIERLPSPPADEAAAVMSHLATVRDDLRTRRAIDSDAEFWRLSGADVDRALAGDPPASDRRLGVDRWEPFLCSVVTAAGRRCVGAPAVAGAGAGPAHVLDDIRTATAPEGRCVLVASQPEPALAPLLWNAAGLVTRAGSTAAHLIEFAHSLGVPTVVGCDLPDLAAAGEPPLVAVDGASGVVSLAWL